MLNLFIESGFSYEVKASVDINTVANAVYKHNFPETLLLNRNIENLSASFIDELGVDTILMSPPCQPFTRNGLKGDVEDNRTNAFKCILDLLPQLKNVRKILMENVKGFESSVMRGKFVESLKEAGFFYREYILSPAQFGVPNSRMRYYCLAAKNSTRFTENNSEEINTNLPLENIETFALSNILEKSIDFETYKIPEKVLEKRVAVLDICYSNCRRSCCFTKAYGRYLDGTGSVFSENNKEFDKRVVDQLTDSELSPEQRVELVRSLRLRFFTPREISMLMCFPESFSFPENVSRKQRYMLLGNSVNVKVVSELIKVLNT